MFWIEFVTPEDVPEDIKAGFLNATTTPDYSKNLPNMESLNLNVAAMAAAAMATVAALMAASFIALFAS